MSGFEITGAVLAAFPLVIAGLEHWRNVEEITGLWRNIKSECAFSRIDMEYHKLIFERRLALLLENIVGSHEEAAKMLGDLNNNWPSDPAIASQLEEQLGDRSLRIYMDTVSRMYSAMQKLRKELGLEMSAVQDKINDKPSQSQASARAAITSHVEYYRFRLQFSMRSSFRAKLLNQIADCNLRLENLLSTDRKVNDSSGPTRGSKRRSRNLEAAFDVAEETSSLLFDTLKTAWQCSCQDQHLANMRLQHRTERGNVWFELVLAFSAAISASSESPWSLRGLRCSPSQYCGLTRRCIKTSKRPTYATVAAAATAGPPSMARKKRARFATVAPESPQIGLLSLDVPTQGLCQELVRSAPGMCLSIDGTSDVPICLHPLPEYNHAVIQSSQSLTQILCQIDRRKRYSIALAVASSAVQFTQTPWMRTCLKKEEIFFYQIGDANVDSGLVGEPFIRQDFKFPASPSNVARPSDSYFHSLGILLLELCFGRSIEDHPHRQQYPISMCDADLIQVINRMAAEQWLKQVPGETGDEYAAAVKWCLTGTIDVGQNWRTAMIKEVIMPLELCQIPERLTSS